MLNFETDLDRSRKTTSVQTHRAEVPQVQERVTVTPLEEAPEPVPAPEPSAPEIHAPASTSAFEWERVRDYVLEQVLTAGPVPRDVRKENTIFMAFVGRWGDLSMKIARYAFEQAQGEWLGAPISVNRFHKTSDPIFAAKIAAMI